MEEDTEVLDWGNEDDELQTVDQQRAAQQQGAYPESRDDVGDDAEDAVSLGGDDDDEIYPYRTTTSDDPPRTQSSARTTPSAQQPPRRDQRENSATPQKQSSHPPGTPHSVRSQPPVTPVKMIHALPPKPAVALPPPLLTPVIHPTTLASAMVRRGERRANGHAKPMSATSELATILPPDWEERTPRGGGRGPYYYNVKTHESTWTRPGAIAELRSPKKRDRASLERSPRHTVENDVLSGRDSSRRPVSPDGHSYPQRHERSGELIEPRGMRSTTNGRSSQRLSPKLPPRPISPRAIDRRESRSMTPPRRRARSLERFGRTHREPSLEPVGRNGWREPQIPAEDRNQPRARNMPPPPDRRREEESANAPPRGRRTRSDYDLQPEAKRVTQDTRGSHDVWPVSRTRSPPPHLRDPSPPRRYSQTLEPIEREVPTAPRQRTRSDRPASPVRPVEPYSDVPQRRPRDYDPEYENDIKRRRIDDVDSRSDPYRRAASPERRSSLSIDRPTSASQAPADSSRARKRQPLPPQKDRFREAAKGHATEEPAPYTTSRAQQNGSYTSPVDSYSTSRGPAYVDPPSGPRSQASGPPPRESNHDRSSRNPPTGPAGKSRFDDPSNRDKDAMDIDDPPPVSRTSAPRNDDGPPRRGMYADRPALDVQMDLLPKGPRAMARNDPNRPSPIVSPVIRSQEPASSRALPPHLRADPPASSMRGLPSGSTLSGSRSHPRDRLEDSLDRHYEQPQESSSSRHQDPPRTRRADPKPVPPPKLSGTNEGQYPQKDYQKPPSPEQSRRDTDRGTGRYATDNFRAPPLRGPPTTDLPPTNHRTSVSDMPSRRESLSSRSNAEIPPPSPVFAMPSSNGPNSQRTHDRDGGDSSSSRTGARTSRFGPEHPRGPQTPIDDTPRVWLTKADVEKQNGGQEQRPPNPGRNSESSRAPRYSRDETIPSPRDRHSSSYRPEYDDSPGQYDRPPSPRGRGQPTEEPRSRVRAASKERRPILDTRPSSRYDISTETSRAPSRSGGREDRSYPDENSRAAYESRDSHRSRRDDQSLATDSRASTRRDRSPPYPPPDPLPLSLPQRRSSPGHSRRRDDDRAPSPDDDSQRGAKRGGSLLERLALDPMPSGSSPSLRERVEPLKRTLPEVSGLPPRPSFETTTDAELNMAGGAGRGKRRPKRGRRGAP